MSEATTQPPAAPRAVFVSYSHDDAAAARRLAEALRAAGLEVWFDENELRSGDTWDAKIKQQIRDCALFLPVISQNTQRRREGYFRLEWHLAEERSRLIARGTPFLVPVAIDDVAERGALVPEVFLSVQWTRLRGGEADAAFGERVNQLLAGGNADPVSDRARAPRVGLQPKVGRRVPAAAWIGVAAAITIAVASLIALRPSPNAGAGTRPPTTEKPVTVTPSSPPTAAPRLGPKSIAVLPFENLSEDKDANAFFADGMHEDLITNLLLIRELRCVPRTTAMSFRGTQKTLREIADELGVAYVLTGTVRRADKRMRLTGTLINPRTDETLWSKPYDKENTDAGVIFAIQSELAQAIAGELKAVLSLSEKRAVAVAPTENLAAYDLYLKSREVVSKGLRTRAHFEARESLLKSAVELDPKFAVAWGELAEAHVGIIAASLDTTPARLAKATAAIEQALALDPNAPTVIRSQGIYYYFGFDDAERALEQFEKLVRLQPNDPEAQHWLGLTRFGRGQFAEGIAARRQAAALDPANPHYANGLVTSLRLIRRFDEAISEQRRMMKLGPINSGDEAVLTRLAFYATGSLSEAEALVARREAADPNTPDVFTGRKALAIRRGEWTEFLRLDRLRPAVTGSGDLLAGAGLIDLAAIEAALVHLNLGDPNAARTRLGRTPAQLRAQLELEPRNTRFLRYGALAEAILGNKEEALRLIERAASITPEATNKFVGVSISEVRSQVLALIGEKDRAIAEIARLLKTPCNLNVHWMRHAPEYAPLRGDPRFEALLNDSKNNTPLF